MSYSLLSKLIHWSTALIIAGLLCMGLYMSSLTYSPFKEQLYLLHKSFGLLVLVLLGLRVVAFLIHKKPALVQGHAKWEKMLSRGVHIFLYAALLSMPLSGWIMSSAGDYTVQFFGVPLPDIAPKNENLFDFSKEFHEILAIILIIVIGLHAMGAFKHHFIDKDQTLARMTSFKIGHKGALSLFVLVVCVAGVLGVLILGGGGDEGSVQESVEKTTQTISFDHDIAQGERAKQWFIDSERSTLSFLVKQYGQPLEGGFNNFDGEIYFDPNQLQKSYAVIKVDISSIKTGSTDRDAQAVSGTWFDAQAFPFAVYEVESFDVFGDEGDYIAHGFLTVRDVRVAVDFPFDLQFSGDGKEVEMSAQLYINRLDFGVGADQGVDAISNNVELNIKLVATSP